MRHVVMYSGGIGSWAAAKRVALEHGTDDLTLLFADTRTEDEDTYRFLRESAVNVGGELVEIADGRTIWQLFHERRWLGNSRAAICSLVLKRERCERWLKEHCNPDETRIYLGLDWSEGDRIERNCRRWLPWICEAPMAERPLLTKGDMHRWAESEGLSRQYLYQIGASHANCGGLCVKMGQGGFARALVTMPDRFREWELQEDALRAKLGDVSILKDRRGGTVRPLPLRELRERLEAGYQPDLFSIGGCGCFSDVEDSE